jgi:hypothetical protein
MKDEPIKKLELITQYIKKQLYQKYYNRTLVSQKNIYL